MELEVPKKHFFTISLDWFVWENLNRKPWFLPSNCLGFPVNFPIIQFYDHLKNVEKRQDFPMDSQIRHVM